MLLVQSIFYNFWYGDLLGVLTCNLRILDEIIILLTFYFIFENISAEHYLYKISFMGLNDKLFFF